MGSRVKKAIPIIATTVLATTAFTTQSFFNDGNGHKVEAKEFSKEEVKQNDSTWLAGDHHVHSEWSVGWDNSTNPPTPIRAGDAIYPITKMQKRQGVRS